MGRERERLIKLQTQWEGRMNGGQSGPLGVFYDGWRDGFRGGIRVRHRLDLWERALLMR